MAKFAKSVTLLLLLTLTLSLKTQARESRFFSKVTRADAEAKPIDDVRQVQLEAKDDDQPAFLPQTPNTAYGLYGRLSQTDSAPTTTTTTTQKYQEPAFDNNKNPNYFNNQYNFESTTKDAATEPEFYDNYGQSKNYAPELRGAYTYKKSGGGSSAWNGEKQGMSDTRFLENGRYFYDLENEKETMKSNDVQSYTNGWKQEYYDNQGRSYSNGWNKAPEYYNNQGRSYSNGGWNKAPEEYYNNEGYYSGSARTYNKNTGNSFIGGDQQSHEEEFDFDP